MVWKEAVVDELEILPWDLPSGWTDIRHLWATYKNKFGCPADS